MSRPVRRFRSAILHAVIAVAVSYAAPAGAQIAPLTAAPEGEPPAAPWRIVTLPKITRHTSYRIVAIDGRTAVRGESDGGYANVLHPFNADINATPVLRFSWRADQFPVGSDLRSKEGDDLAAKVCVLFDLPLSRLSFADRVRVELGRRLFDPDLPSATLCYVWDRTLSPGTWLPNAYTDRVRMLVLRSAQAREAGRWFEERRNLKADFTRAFGSEAGDQLPPLKAIAFATDADNTQSRALAYFGNLSLTAE